MNKKIGLLIIFILIILLIFLLFLIYNIYSFQTPEKVIVEQQESLTSILPAGNLLLNIKQSTEGYFLEFKTQDKYSCSNLDYDFNVDENQGILKLDLRGVIKYNSCDRKEINLIKQEKIPSARDWTLELKYKDKNLIYNINYENNYFNILNNEDKKDQSYFENQSYRVVSSNVAKITIDYEDKLLEKEANNILSRLGVLQKQIDLDETQLSFDNLKTLSFKSTTQYSINKYFEFDNEEIFKTIINQYKARDCYLNKNLKNCISIDIRTSSGRRYCTWLNVVY